MKLLFPIILILMILLCLNTINAQDLTNDTLNTQNTNTYNQVNDSSTNNVDNKIITSTSSIENSSESNYENQSATKNITKNTSSNEKLSANNLATVYISTSGKDSNTGSSNSPKKTLTSALTTVKNGGTIYLTSGTYTFSGILINKNVTIIGKSTTSTIINAKNKHLFTINNNARVTLKTFRILNAKSTSGGAIYNRGTLTLQGIAIENSTATTGAGIYNKGTLTVTKSYFSANKATIGGAIYNSGKLTVTKSAFSKNRATNFAGAIYSTGKLAVSGTNFTSNNNGTIFIAGTHSNTISSSSFKSNTGTRGSTIYTKSTLTVTKTGFDSNRASKYGGAIYNTAALTIKSSTFKKNYASQGGAIYNLNKLTIQGSKFANNTAKTFGGAIFSSRTARIVNIITDTQFLNNKASTGGAIYSQKYSLFNIKTSIFNTNNNNAIYLKTIGSSNIIHNSSFYANKAGTGGAINNQGSQLTVNKTTLSANSASIGGAIYNNKGKIYVQYSVIKNNNKIDLYNSKGKIISNYNWWGSNKRPSSSRIYNNTLTNWIYFTLNSATINVNKSATTVVSFNNINNGKSISALKTYTIPSLSLKITIKGGGVNKNYAVSTKNGVYSVTNKYTKAGTAIVTAYTTSQEMVKTINVKQPTSKITALFVQIGASVSSSTVKTWVSSGITDVYVQTRASTSNTEKLRQVITLTKNTNIRVHAWVICFSTTNGFDISSSQQNMIKNFIYKVVRISGVDGVCLDYVRYSGTTKNVDSSVITNFVKNVNSIVKGYNKNLKVAACVFPEMSQTKVYYGQDYAALSPYVDVMLPMVYKYDYNEDRAWLKEVVTYIKKRATKSQVVAVLQTYKETSSSLIQLSKSELTLDAKAVISAGSSGYCLFRYGLISGYPGSSTKL